jgi:hypothetical protein
VDEQQRQQVINWLDQEIQRVSGSKLADYPQSVQELLLNLYEQEKSIRETVRRWRLGA